MCTLREAVLSDVDEVWRMISSAKIEMGKMGRNQWQGEYPARRNVADDVARRLGYVLLHDERIVGYSFISAIGEPVYDKLYDGAWITGKSKDYVVFHRMVIDPMLWNKGYSLELWRNCLNFSRNNGSKSCRVDTNYDNVAILHTLEKLGFTNCGKVFYPLSGERLAFERLI